MWAKPSQFCQRTLAQLCPPHIGITLFTLRKSLHAKVQSRFTPTLTNAQKGRCKRNFAWLAWTICPTLTVGWQFVGLGKSIRLLSFIDKLGQFVGLEKGKATFITCGYFRAGRTTWNVPRRNTSVRKEAAAFNIVLARVGRNKHQQVFTIGHQLWQSEEDRTAVLNLNIFFYICQRFTGRRFPKLPPSQILFH
jgi:hypothetical protein